MGGEKMSTDLENFDFLELGQAIQDAHEKQRITREELAEEIGISARHLQSVEKEGQYPNFRLFTIQYQTTKAGWQNLFLLQFPGIKLIIHSLLCQQALMVSPFHNPSMIQYHDHI